MKGILYLILLLAILDNRSLGCELIVQKQVLVNDIHATENWAGLKTNCLPIKLQSFKALLMRYEGEMPKLKLQSELQKIGIYLSSESEIIHIKNLSLQIKSLPVFKNKKVKIESLHDKIPNISGNRLEFKLDNSNKITVATTGLKPTSFKSKLIYKEKVECIVASNNITPYSKQKNYKKVAKWLHPHEKESIFKSKKELNKYLRHYKFSNFIKKDKTIDKSFFIKRNLLTFGKPAKVVFKDKNLTISTSGTPQSNGGINDSVLIKLSNNKIISAYIIDKDKVSASL